VTAGAGDVEYRLLVDGLPLDQFLPRVAGGVAQPRELGRGGRVVVSAGHGWYWHEACFCTDPNKAKDPSAPFSNIVRCDGQ
jgi:hypothetical protein